VKVVGELELCTNFIFILQTHLRYIVSFISETNAVSVFPADVVSGSSGQEAEPSGHVGG